MLLPLSFVPLRRLALMFGLATAVGCGVLGLMLWQMMPVNRLAAARGRWSAQAPPHYRMVSEAGARCVLDVEVKGEEVVAVHRNDHCSPPARTVSELFRLIDSIRVVNYPCAGANCACRTVMGTTAQFDALRGFPRSITLWSRREPNWWTANYWRTALSFASSPCDRRSEAVMVRVISFTAIP